MSADFLAGVTQRVTEQTMQSLPSPMTAMPDASTMDVAQFEHAMNVPQTEGAQPVNGDTMLSTSPAAADVTAPNSGDAILGGLQKMTSSYNANAANLQQSIEAAANNPGDMTAMFKIQYQMSTLTLQQDLTAKVADRANQGVQTFFKNQ